MKTTRRKFCYVASAFASTRFAGAQRVPEQHRKSEDLTWSLWYSQPAERWLEALPVGNGRLGAMVFGGVQREKLALNEATVWSGAPNASNVNPQAQAHLAETRKLLFAGKYAEGNALAAKMLGGREDDYGTHLPMANLVIDSGDTAETPQHYRRLLDLQTGVARVEYSRGRSRFRREVFASHPDGVLVIRMTCDKPGQIGFALGLDAGDLPGAVEARGDDTLILTGSSWERKHSDGHIGLDFETWARVTATGGSVEARGSRLQVKDADSLTLLVAAHTNYREPDSTDRCRRQIEAAAGKSYAQLLQRHVEDYQRLFGRVAIDLGGAEAADTATDKRLTAVRKGGEDAHLMAQFFQYGRYLLIAGSRADSPLPMNLQGIWNDNRACNMPWTCDFHLDINTQQNYWHAETCNLSECSEPLFRLVEALSKEGKTTARGMYGANGWVAHVYTNSWGFTAPGRGLPWGLFVTGGVWIATHLWEHYLFTKDRVFLEQRAYPVLKEAAAFFLDYMAPDPKHGWLVTGPSLSPENQFLAPDGTKCSVSMGPTVDRELVDALFGACLTGATVLQRDAEFQQRVRAARAKLSPLQIGRHGQLMEWLEDFEEAQPNHRHTSHLVALYPLHQITPDKTPKLAQAARVTIARRTGQSNWEDVEWSRANMVNFLARLRDAEAAHRNLMGLLRNDTDLNMMTFSRGGIAGAQDNIFAIDGNTAGAAGVVEMLLQSHDEIHLLPALPRAWANGSVRGLKARGGFEVDIRWQKGRLARAAIRAQFAGRRMVRYGEQRRWLMFRAGQSIEIAPEI